MPDPAMFTDGEIYERLMGKWSQQVGTQFLNWLGARQGASWLDVGCGTGAFSEVLINEAKPSAVQGIDPSPEQIAFAKKRKTTASVKFQVGDAQDLPFAERAFDATAMALVIAFVPDPLKAVKEMRRVTKPGGHVASYMWDLPADGVPMWPINVAIKAMGLERPVPASGKASAKEPLLEIWKAAGLTNIRQREIRIPVDFSNIDEFMTSTMLPVGPIGVFLKTLSTAQMNEMKDLLRAQAKPDPDGHIRYEAFANAIDGIAV